jgi:hypothetical protein
MLRKLLVLAITSGFAASVVKRLLAQPGPRQASVVPDGSPDSDADVEAVQAWRHAASDQARSNHAGSLKKTVIPPDIP